MLEASAGATNSSGSAPHTAGDSAARALNGRFLPLRWLRGHHFALPQGSCGKPTTALYVGNGGGSSPILGSARGGTSFGEARG
jgi:hypothetical protein